MPRNIDVVDVRNGTLHKLASVSAPGDWGGTANLGGGAMRRTHRLSFAFALLLGCKGGAGSAGNMQMSDAALHVADGYLAAWNAHDAARAASFFTDSVVYLDAYVGTPLVGRDNVRKNMIQAYLTIAPDCRWVRDGDAVVSPAGDAVAFQWTYSATNTGPWPDGTKATGKAFSFKGLTLMRLKDGKIVSQFDSYDALGINKQLGLK
jgi:uncharacterized protein (TIGR02246 family)